MYGLNHPERIKFNNQIKEWNTNRLDLFQISEPNEALDFYGVMRFFYQGEDLKYQTKCIRVSSTATTLDVNDALIVKFHPDTKRMNKDKYALYETHNLEERKMKNHEHPLKVQLNWAVDDKDGKFILKNESRRRRSTDMTNHTSLSNYGMSQSTSTLANGYDSQTLRTQSSAVYNNSSNFFSRRFSSSKKSKRKGKDAIEDAEDAKRLAEEISGKPPESSFTRTISNPDDVMKRRRQKKLEFRLEQFSGAKGDGETGGTLKIYGNSINPDIPYKTLLLSVNDTTDKVLSETLDKYGVPSDDHRSYVLVQQNIPPREDKGRAHVEEIILHDQDCPLGILVHCPPKRGSATFAVRRVMKTDKFPISARMPPFAFSKDVRTTTSANRNKGHHNTKRELSSSPTPPDEYLENVQECPRLKKLIIDADGTMFEDEDGTFSLSSLVNLQSKNSRPTEGSKLIKIGSQPSVVGSHPNILLSPKAHSDIRPVHCHISAKLDPQSNTMKFQLTPTLDSSSRTPRACVIFVNQQRIDSSTRIVNGDIIQLGESAIFKLEEFDDEAESINDGSVDESAQEHLKESSDSLDRSYFTADLPITLKYTYKRSPKLVDLIMKYSNEYAERGSKELFSGNSKLEVNNLDETFRLSPAYMLYLVMRAGLANEQEIVQLVELVADRIDKVIEQDCNNLEKEIFWLSNTSELLHLLQYDSDLRGYSGTAQDVLAGAIERAFTIVQQQFSQDLMILLPALLNEDDSDMDDNTQEDNIPCLDRASVLTEQGSIDYPIQHLLQTLSLAFNLFHNCQVNVALTIQMFSQLFHLLNTWLFNSILGQQSTTDDNDTLSIPICQEWGSRLTRRLNRIQYWSEINGLEMAANCHLQKMYQVSELMEADKLDLQMFGEKCLEMVNLNGAQLHHLLINCQDYELPDPWIEVVVNTSIQLHERDFNDHTESKTVSQNKNTLPLYEDMDLRLPLLLPADGYCCDRGIVSCPTDLKALLKSLDDTIIYHLNPPILNQKDVRWKSYLGTCENTPTVSRSSTIIEQTTSTSSTVDAPNLPRNWVNPTLPSEGVSTSTTLSTPRERYQKKPNITSLSSQLTSSQARYSVPTSDRQTNDSRESSNSTIKSDTMELRLMKIDNSLGLSIIAAKASSNDIFRIYVKDVIVGGAGYKSGKISPGDQLVSIDGNLLDDMNQEEAVAFMKKTKSEVVLVIEKAAAQKRGVMDSINLAKNSKLNPTSQKPLRAFSPLQVPAIKAPPAKPNHALKIHFEEPQTKLRESQLSLVHPPTTKTAPKTSQAPPSKQTKPAPRKISDLGAVEPEYSTLQVRKPPPSKSTLPETPVYATVKKDKSLKVNNDINLHPLSNNNPKASKSNSQPNLNHIVPKSKRTSESLSSGTGSSYSTSSSDEEVSTKSLGKLESENSGQRDSSPVYEKMPYEDTEDQLIKTPEKAVSEMNIQSKNIGIPRHEISSSAAELRSGVPKKQFLSRPVLAVNSDSFSSTSSQDDSVSMSFNKPVSREQLSSSESETETVSSNTESTSSSDHSPQPQIKMISLPTNTDNKKPLEFDYPKEADQIPKGNTSAGTPHLGGFKTPLRLTNETPITYPVSKKDDIPSSIRPTQTHDRPVLIMNKVADDEKPKTKPAQVVPPDLHSPCSSLPPPPPASATISYHQYIPPSDLKEADWTDPHWYEPPKASNEDEIKLRRKLIADNIRQDNEEKERNSKSQEIQAIVKPEEKKEKIRSSTQYGRPQFNENSSFLNQVGRPGSLFRPESTSVFNSLDTDFNLPSPPSSLLHDGIVVPASPVLKSKVGQVGHSSRDSHNTQVGSSRGDSNRESVDELSFGEKMKLFASKMGQEQIVERKKFSSKQRRIESGDFS